MQVVGVPPTVVRNLRVAAGGHLGVKPGWCATVAFALEGARDPAVALRTAMIEESSAFCVREPALRQRIEYTWQHCLGTLRAAPSSKRWSTARADRRYHCDATRLGLGTKIIDGMATSQWR